MEQIQLILLIVIILLILITKKFSNNPVPKLGRGKKIVMDSSALIDGRILEIVRAGFAPSQIIVPRFIINELQLLADGSDTHKRERARFGLDVVKSLQESAECNVYIWDDKIDPKIPTDNKLVVVAARLAASLCTTDYNLNKVATIEGVRVLNVNELANALRPVALPGEHKKVKIVQKGSSKNQGVGYLDDGSMVVVENASGLIGKIVNIEVSRYIQTDAGKMLFGHATDRGRARQSAKR